MSNFIKRFLGLPAFKPNAELEKIKDLKESMFEMPASLANPMMDFMLERQYLEDISTRTDYLPIDKDRMGKMVKWIRIDRLPVSPSRIDDYDLLTRWQGVLSSLHAWKQEFILLLQRCGGQTRLYIGLPNSIANEGIATCKSALVSSMPGIKITPIKDVDEIKSLHDKIDGASCGGAITGMPSFRSNTEFGILQTLDKLANGFVDKNGYDGDFSFIVVARPMKDETITDTISKFQNIGSEIHTEVMARVSQSETVQHSEGSSTGVNAGITLSKGHGTMEDMVKGLMCLMYGIFPGGTAKSVLKALSVSGSVGCSRTVFQSDGVSYGESVTKEYLNKFAQYTEQLTDKHCQRLRAGRNLGFWNTAVYVLANTTNDVNLVMGILRSVYSGDSTFIEPIRTHILQSPNALNYIKNFEFIPLLQPSAAEVYQPEEGIWHILGEPYQYVSTPVNTEELSLFTSLPRRDVAGIRFVKNAVKFASNPAVVADEDSTIRLGKIMNMGEPQTNKYTIDFNSLVRHTLIAGSTGCGKTNTAATIIKEVIRKDRPTLIIEPAKEEWVEWAIEQNKHLPPEKQFKIYMPGVSNYNGARLENLMLNPFQPAAVAGAEIDMQTRCEQLTAVINSSLPTGDILPIIMDEALYTYLDENVKDFREDEMEQMTQYPKLDGVLVVAKRILEGRGYEPRVRDGLTAALETRFKYLTRGKRGKILNNLVSTPFDTLFGSNCVINLSHIANAKDQALIMSILLIALYEYRKSCYTHDEQYRARAKKNELLHLTVIEEAHNVLARPVLSAEGSGNPQQVAADLFSKIISEVRSYGEGLMIIDQVPGKLIPEIVKNTNYKVCHRMTSPDDASIMVVALGLRDDQRDLIPALEVGHAIIAGDRDDAAAWVNIDLNK